MNYPCRSKEGYERRVAENTNTAMQTVLLISTQALLVILLAEFAAGVVHWFEDAYIREDTPLVGNLIGRPNVIHHHLPRHMTRNNWWQSSWDLLLVSAVIVLLAWALGCLTWHVWLFAAVSANANEFHKWAHRTRRENGRIISFLQAIRLLQTPQHHALHHTNPKNVRYCVVTNALNPLLDRARFWEGLEWLLARTIGLHRRPDTSLSGHGPAPAWLNEVRRSESVDSTPVRERSVAAMGCAALLILSLVSGTGCRTTNLAVQNARQPQVRSTAHQVTRLESAGLTADGGLILHATGRLAGERKETALQITLPRWSHADQSPAQRINLPATAVQADRDSDRPTRPVPVGPPLVFKGGSTYEWHQLRPVAAHGEEVRLVRRLGAVQQWEVLHLKANAAAEECRFTVFEVQPIREVARSPGAMALVPLAVAYDAVDNAAAVTSVGAVVGLGLFGAPGLLMAFDELEPVKRFRGR